MWSASPPAFRILHRSSSEAGYQLRRRREDAEHQQVPSFDLWRKLDPRAYCSPFSPPGRGSRYTLTSSLRPAPGLTTTGAMNLGS